MNTLSKFFGRRLMGKTAAVAGALALVAGAASAQNNFTDAGTNVQNTFTLDYTVGTTPQPTITNDPATTIPGAVVQGTETEFTVDRVVDLIVQEAAPTVNVTPGQTGAILSYTLTNEGNDAQSYSVSLEDVTPADDFDETPYTITWYYDANNDGDFTNDGAANTGTITEVTPGTASTGNITVDVLPDFDVLFEISTDIDSARSDAEEDGVILVAETRDPTAWLVDPTATTAGDKTDRDTDGNDADPTAVAENVFADTDGTSAIEATAGAVGQGANPDGMHSATSTFVVQSADLDADKAVSLLAPTACGVAAADQAEPGYYLPNACVQYVISVENTGATAAATDVDISDILPEELVFFSAVAAGWDVAPTDSFPAPGTACNGAVAVPTCEVEVTGGTINAGNTATLTIVASVK